MRNGLHILTVLLATAFPAAAAPGNLIINGDFEAAPYDTLGTVTGWTVSGTGNIDSATQGATSGTHSAAFSATGNSQGNVLSQSFATIVGRVYSLDFDVGTFGTTSSASQLHVQ